MSVRRTLDAFRPHLWSVGVPLAWLIVGGTAWIAATVAIGPAVEHLPPRAQLVGHVAAAMGLTVIASWLAFRFRRALTQGRRDEEAAELLDLLRLEALQPGTVLLEVHDVQWTARSGQRVWAVDVLTGEVSDRWIPRPGSEPGSLVLLRQSSGRPVDVVARMLPTVLVAADRHRGREANRTASAGRMVVAEAERLLDE